MHFDTYLTKLDTLNSAMNEKIAYLESKVSALENKTTEPQDNLDDVNQYERQDTVIISGPALPDEATHGNRFGVMVNRYYKANPTHKYDSHGHKRCSSPGPKTTRQKEKKSH